MARKKKKNNNIHFVIFAVIFVIIAIVALQNYTGASFLEPCKGAIKLKVNIQPTDDAEKYSALLSVEHPEGCRGKQVTFEYYDGEISETPTEQKIKSVDSTIRSSIIYSFDLDVKGKIGETWHFCASADLDGDGELRAGEERFCKKVEYGGDPAKMDNPEIKISDVIGESRESVIVETPIQPGWNLVGIIGMADKSDFLLKPTAYWIAWGSPSGTTTEVEMEYEYSFGLSDIRLAPGWNFVPILLDMHKKTLKDISGTCIINDVYAFDPSEGEGGEWIGLISRVKFSKTSGSEYLRVGRGIVVNVAEACTFGSDTTLPAPPELPVVEPELPSPISRIETISYNKLTQQMRVDLDLSGQESISPSTINLILSDAEGNLICSSNGIGICTRGCNQQITKQPHELQLDLSNKCNSLASEYYANKQVYVDIYIRGSLELKGAELYIL